MKSYFKMTDMLPVYNGQVSLLSGQIDGDEGKGGQMALVNHNRVLDLGTRSTLLSNAVAPDFAGSLSEISVSDNLRYM
jgi:hypothetical protein